MQPIIHLLTYRGRTDLAQHLNGSLYELNESNTYGKSPLFKTHYC